jgi:hypothetical protein
MSQHPRPRDFARPFCVALTVLAGVPAFASADPPRTGDLISVQVITISVHAGGFDRDTKTASYTPPAGWYVRSHSITQLEHRGNTSFAVSTFPGGWLGGLAEDAAGSAQNSVEAAARFREVGVEAKLKHDQKSANRDLRDSHYSHHALIVEATAQGAGYFRPTSGLELVVTADLIYMGADSPQARPVLQFDEMK